MNDSRKLAIKNLKGSDEEMRVAWMLKNMSENKTFKYLLKDKKFKHKNALLEELQNRYKTYRNQWRGNAKFAPSVSPDSTSFTTQFLSVLCKKIVPPPPRVSSSPQPFPSGVNMVLFGVAEEADGFLVRSGVTDKGVSI